MVKRSGRRISSTFACMVLEVLIGRQVRKLYRRLAVRIRNFADPFDMGLSPILVVDPQSLEHTWHA